MDAMKDDGNRPATKAELVEFLRGMATKEDLRGMATKGDLRGLATKDDLRGLATKDDLRGLATKEELGELRTEMREMVRPLAITLAHHTAELADIRGYMKDKLVTRDEFHARMDAFTGRVDDSDYSAAKNRDRLDAHERRITALERKRA